MRRRLALLAVAAAGTLLVPAVPAAAKTIVSGPDRNNVVTITVPIDCVGCKDYGDPINGRDLAKYWEEIAEKRWNDAFAKYSYCNKYKFKLDIKMRNRPAGSATTFDRHELFATQPDGSGFRGAGWGGAPESTPGGPEGQRASDGTRYYEYAAQGTMPADATPTVIAHELGHVIGLGDDRDADGNPIGPDPKGIMVGGASGVTPKTNLKITKNHVDRIGQQLENLGTITCGEKWNGTLNTTEGGPGGSGGTNGSFSLKVTTQGTVTGTGSSHTTLSTAGGDTSLDSQITVTGTREGRTFQLQIALNPGTSIAVDARVRGDLATGSIDLTGEGGTYSRGEIRLECQNCDEDEAVG